MLNDRQEALCRDGPHDFAGLRALFVNTSPRRDGGESHTGLLMGASVAVMERVGVHVDRLRMLDHHVPPGVHPDMTEHGCERDDWPALWTGCSRPTSSWWARPFGSARSPRFAAC